MNKDENEVMSVKDRKAIADALKEFDPNLQMVIKDLFAIGCYFRLSGLLESGYKACLTAMRALPLEERVYNKIFTNLDGNEKELARLFMPHAEIGKLIGDE